MLHLKPHTNDQMDACMHPEHLTDAEEMHIVFLEERKAEITINPRSLWGQGHDNARRDGVARVRL